MTVLSAKSEDYTTTLTTPLEISIGDSSFDGMHSFLKPLVNSSYETILGWKLRLRSHDAVTF